MTHEMFEELVSAYVDSQLTPEEERALVEHMKDCASCRKLYEQEKIIKERLHRIKEIIPIQPDLNEKLIRSIERSKNKNKKFFFILLALLIFLFLWMLVFFIG